MLGSRFTVLAFALPLLGALACTPPPPPPAPPEAQLDHFLCYEGRGAGAVGEEITLEDQFDRLSHAQDTVTVQPPFAFCNPVSKTRRGESEDILDDDHHLVAYRINSRRDRMWSATLHNQLDSIGVRLSFGPAHWMLVPTRKLAPNQHPAPRGLNHFKCYLVNEGPMPMGNVDLLDEFETPLRGVVLTRPLALCAPADKFRDGRDPEPTDRSGVHLVCYGLERSYDQRVRYSNQFEARGTMALTRVFGLCVPSRKEGVRRGGPES